MALTSCFVALRFWKLKRGTPDHNRTVWLQYTVHAYIERQYTWSGGGVPEVMLHAVFLHTTFPEVASVRPTSCSMLSRRHGLGGRPIMCIHLSLRMLPPQIIINTTCCPSWHAIHFLFVGRGGERERWRGRDGGRERREEGRERTRDRRRDG